MTSPYWNAEVEPGTGTTVLEAVFTPTINAVGIRSDDRITAMVDTTRHGGFVVTLESKPPGEWQWSGPARTAVELAREPSGQVRCELRPAGRPEASHPVGDTQAALALGLDRHTWLSVRSILETGMDHAAALTAADVARADLPQVIPWAVARRLAELTAQAGVPPTAAPRNRPADAVWETVSSLPASSRQRPLPGIPPDRPLSPPRRSRDE